MSLGTPTYPTTLDTAATLGPTSGIVAGTTPLNAVGTNQGDQLGITNNLINQVIALQTKCGVTASADTSSLDYKISQIQAGQATVNFGATDTGDDSVASTTVTATWANGTTSNITCAVVPGSDHADEDPWVENVSAYVQNFVNGTSFDIVIHAPTGAVGNYLVNYISG